MLDVVVVPGSFYVFSYGDPFYFLFVGVIGQHVFFLALLFRPVLSGLAASLHSLSQTFCLLCWF